MGDAMPPFSHTPAEPEAGERAAARAPVLSMARSPSLAEQSADAIVTGIASGVLKPGQRLVEAELASMLRISRVPLREGGVGMLPVDDLVGRVDGIVASWDLGMRSRPVWTWPQGLRLSRFFSAVH